MNIRDLVARAETISKQYEKYTKEAKKEKKVDKKLGDSFASELEDVESRVADIAAVAEEIAQLRDRPTIAAKNAEIRRRKNAVITEDIAELKKLAVKGKVGKEEAQARLKQIDELEEKVYAIPDGMNVARKKPGLPPKRTGLLGGSKKHHVEIDVDLNDVNNNPAYYEVNEENKAFDDEWQVAKRRQDEQLDIIEQGVGNLKNIAADMGGELKRQDMLLDEIEDKMDRNTKGIETNNQKLAGVLRKVRSQRNFCIDICLLIVLLSIGAYIYSMFRK